MHSASIKSYILRTSCYNDPKRPAPMPPVGVLHEITFVFEGPPDRSGKRPDEKPRALFVYDPPLGPPPDEFFGTFGSGLGHFRLRADLFDGIYQLLRAEKSVTIWWETDSAGRVTSFEIGNDPVDGSPVGGTPSGGGAA